MHFLSDKNLLQLQIHLESLLRRQKSKSLYGMNNPYAFIIFSLCLLCINHGSKQSVLPLQAKRISTARNESCSRQG